MKDTVFAAIVCKKCSAEQLHAEIDRIQKNLLSQSEKIKTASRHMKIAEEEAEKIAKTRDTE